jgi:hypothetical protein
MKNLMMIIILLPSTLVFGRCALKDAELKELCPVRCMCGVMEKERIIADCTKGNYTSIPPCFPKLNSLNFSRNWLTEVRYINFKHEHFRNIQSIDLSNNEIRNIETKSFENLTQLRYLDLSSNKIGSVTPESFKELKNLKILDLRGNSIDCTALKNELTGISILCSSSEEYAYSTTMATATLTKATDSNMEIPEVSYTDDTMVQTVTLSTESSSVIKRHFDPETVTKTNMNDIEMHITRSTKNYDSSAFGVTQITHGIAADQQPSTMPAINEETSAVQIVTIICSILVLLIGVYEGVFIWCHKHTYTKVQTHPEDSSCLSSIATT